MDHESRLLAVAAVILLLGVLAFAVVRPRGLPEAVAAAPAALLVIAMGLVPWRDVGAELVALGPTIAFLAAVLTLAHVADERGVFTYLGAVVGRLSGGSPRRLLRLVFAAASVVTATLSLDATVVLLTPVVLATAAEVGARPKPHLYACGHLANSASLLLPVSNLTNLLAFGAAGLGFSRSAGVMAVPWLVAIGIEYLIFRWWFAVDLGTPERPVPPHPTAVPRFALIVLGATLAGFGVSGPAGISPAWIAAAAAAVLAAPRLVRRPATEARRLVRAANLPFCVFVLALGVVVLAVRAGPVGAAVAGLMPHRPDFAGLLAAASIAALLANVLNNLPATLLLVPLVAPSSGLVLAVLLGVNIGPNLTYVGSLATLLWRQVLHARDHAPAAGEFLRLGAVTVPACLLAGVAALWAALRLFGLS